MKANLFTAQQTNASSSGVRWPGGNGTFFAWGTFDGGTVKLQTSPDNGTTWIDVGTDTTKTANGIGNFGLSPCLLRGNVASGGGSLNVNATVESLTQTITKE